MNGDWIQNMLADTDRSIRIWHRFFLWDCLLSLLNLGNSVAFGLDTWSKDEWALSLVSSLLLAVSAFMAAQARKSLRRARAYQRMRFNVQRLIEAEKSLFRTTSPSEAALEQLMASFEELKRL